MSGYGCRYDYNDSVGRALFHVVASLKCFKCYVASAVVGRTDGRMACDRPVQSQSLLTAGTGYLPRLVSMHDCCSCGNLALLVIRVQCGNARGTTAARTRSFDGVTRGESLRGCMSEESRQGKQCQVQLSLMLVLACTIVAPSQ